MRTKTLFIAACILVCCGATLRSQTAQPTKIGIFDSEALGDPKGGIKRLVGAFEQLNREFKPKMDELQGLRTKYDTLVKSIQDTKTVADQKTLQAKADEAETLKSDIERKQQDGQKALDKRTKELTEPIYANVSAALQAFAKGRGFDMVFDISKMAGVIMVVNPTVDITDDFIADYNAKNGAATVPPGVPIKTP